MGNTCKPKKLDNIDEIDKLIKTEDLPRLNPEKEMENLDIPMISKEIQLDNQSCDNEKTRSYGFTGKFYQTFKELTPNILNII